VTAFWSRRNTKNPLLPFLLFLLLTCMVNPSAVARAETGTGASEPVLIATLDRESARVGDLVSLTLSYRLPAGARLPREPEIKGIEELTIVERLQETDRIEVKFVVDRLEPWKSGPISLTYVDRNGEEKTVSAGPVSLTVLSNLGQKPEEAGLRPIQDIIHIEPRWFKYLPWAAALAVLLFIIAALTRWYRKRRPRQVLAEVIDPPHITAAKEIDRLEARGLFEKGEIKAFYFNLSEILRKYMESIRHFPAAEYTTEEISHRIRNHEEDRKILPLLRQADLVKFADTVPTPARKEEDVQMVRLYIQETGLLSESVHGELETREGAQ